MSRPRPDVYHKVWSALQTGCRDGQAPLSTEDLIEIAPDALLSELSRKYPTRSQQGAMRYVLDRLTRTGEVHFVRTRGRRWYSMPGLAGAGAEVTPCSRRQRALDFVTAAVEHFGRPVRAVDLRSFAEGKAEYADVLTWLSHSLGTLKAFDELQVVAECQGGGADGSYYYLPAGYDPAKYASEQSRTWIELVEDAFNQAWSSEVERARESATRPRPILVGTIRALLLADDQGSKAAEAQLVINAVNAVAQRESPGLRVVTRSGARYQRLWAPVDVPDEALDLGSVYASDAERLVEGVRRACAHSGEPAASVPGVKRQIEADPLLHLAGSQPVAAALSSLARRSGEATKPRTRNRITQRIVNAGRVGSRTYYVAPPAESDAQAAEAVDGARVHVAALQIEADFSALRIEAEVSGAAIARIASVRTGRLRYLSQQLRGLHSRLHAHGRRLGDRAAHLVNQIEDRLAGLAELPDYHAGDHSALPWEVELPRVGWSGEQLVSLFSHVYRGNPRMEDHNHLARNLWHLCERIPNPDFSTRTKSAEFLYEATTVFLQLAGHSIGREAVMLAGMAEAELGPLRDARFVLPGLRDDEEQVRHTAIACLGFLPGAGAGEALRSAALHDAFPAVRRSALWAYGVSGGPDASELLRSAARNDQDPRVRGFAEEVLGHAGPTNWWLL